MSPKKGGLHATLVPSLSRNFLPRNTDLEDLLSEELPAAMWHVYFDECKALEDASGENELGLSKNSLWDEDERPSLEKLEKANDFKTPKKVQLGPTTQQDIIGLKLD